MFYFKSDELILTGASPETMLQCRKNQLFLKPIAGTRPRGKTHEEDLHLEKDLLNDKKEIAEHMMLVDLGRNDLGRVSLGDLFTLPSLFLKKYSVFLM